MYRHFKAILTLLVRDMKHERNSDIDMLHTFDLPLRQKYCARKIEKKS